jgi:Cu+-exporting ATPase
VNIVGVVVTGWLWPLFATSPEWYEKAPLAGVLYHQLGSLLVLLNSMRLLAFDRTASSPTLSAVRDRAAALDRWLSTFYLDDLLHEIGHYWKPIAAGVAGVALVAWLASGLTQVNANEVAVVQRFGRIHADLEPGLHVRWPWPVETVTRVRPAEIRAVEVGFRTPVEPAQPVADRMRRPGPADAGLTWSSAHGEGVSPVTDEAEMVTGDGDLVEIFATVRYAVGDHRLYLFAVRDPDAVIRSAAESVLREMVAGQRFLELLTVRRVAFQQEALERLERRLSDVVPTGLGVRLDGLTLHDLHPPKPVVEAYHAVAKAIQDRDRFVNEAEADALKTRRRAEEEALRLERQAAAEAVRRVAEAEASRDAFLAWHAVRTQLPPDEEAKLRVETDTRVKAGQDQAAVEKDVVERRARMLAERRFLVEFRLSLQTVTDVLRQRDKILIDSDGVPGKRHLFLFDPDTLRMPSFPNPNDRAPREP